MRKLGVWSAVLSVFGIIFTFTPFTATAGWLQNQYVLIGGILLFMTSLIVAVLSICKNEKGFLKFIPFILLLPILYFALNFVAIMGGV